MRVNIRRCLKVNNTPPEAMKIINKAPKPSTKHRRNLMNKAKFLSFFFLMVMSFKGLHPKGYAKTGM